MIRKKIMITGSEGFVGSALLDFLSPFHEVYGIDIKEGPDIFNINNITGIDLVIHCAALTSVDESMKKPFDYYKTNVLGTDHIINLCLKYATQLMNFSSAAIFEPETSFYADSKSIAHDIIEVFKDNLRTINLIPYNIYSEKPKKGSLFHHFLNDKELYINGTGRQTRDFINLIDICHIVKTAIDDEWEKVTLELGTGKSTEIQTIANIFHEATGKKIVYRKRNPGIEYSIADIEPLQKYYKKPFKTNLKKDIEKMIAIVN